MIIDPEDPDFDGNIEFVNESFCPVCHAPIHVYHEMTGLLPDEYHGDRRATHTWLVCELRQRINALECEKR